MKPKRRIGILGGVFDPVHNGHLSAALLAKEHFALDAVLFIPSGAPPHKSSVVASREDRLNMLRLALDGVDGCEIWDGEIRRDGYSYTIDTLAELGSVYENAEFHFIMGSDNLAEIGKWRRFEDIVKTVTLCVTERPGHCVDDGMDALAAFARAKVKTFPGPMWGSSSTMLREYLRDGHSCRFMIPDAALAYIKERGLYGHS